MAEEKSYSPGLAGVIAGETEIACVDQGVLLYRGYPIEQLAERSTFEQVAHLLLFGELPDDKQLAELKAALDRYRPLRKELIDALRTFRKTFR
jgi:citrate synthase